jgi:hypothetical protein
MDLLALAAAALIPILHNQEYPQDQLGMTSMY